MIKRELPPQPAAPVMNARAEQGSAFISVRIKPPHAFLILWISALLFVSASCFDQAFAQQNAPNAQAQSAQGPARAPTTLRPAPASPIVAPRPLTPQASSAATPPAAATGLIVQRGSGAFVAQPALFASSLANQSGARLDITFEHAPAALVVQSLLSEMAGASVVIDPRVTGELTIHSHNQLTAPELPDFLRSSLRAIELDLVDQGHNAFLLRPLAHDASGTTVPDVYQPGGAHLQSGLVILSLQHVSATEMARLLQPFARNGVTVQPETMRELLIISGPPAQVDALIQTVELLDVDWLQGMSFGIVPLEYLDPEPLIAQLRTLFGGPTGPIGSMVDFVPVPARRAVLILAKRPERLDEAHNWILQLDRPGTSGASGMRFVRLQNADATQVADTISHLFGEHGDAHVHITADAGRNALLIQADPASYEDIRGIIAELDAPVDQVVIETTIAEVTLNHDFRFGVQWNFDTRNGGHAILSSSDSSAIASSFPGFSYAYAGNFVQATLNALSSRTHVEVISSPVVVTLDNQEATLDVGDQVPIVTQSTANVSTPNATVINSVQYRDTGILLRVKPHVGAGETVTLDVTQEASEVSATTTSGIDSPTIQQRRFHSTVAIADGQTVALGGLIRATRTQNRSGVPILSSIPLFGAPFRSTDNEVRRTELLVFLTPRILRTSADAAAATNDLRDRLARVRASHFIQEAIPTHASVP